jgi:hypothetical protein
LKSDLKFKTENRVNRKENKTEKIEEEAYLAEAHQTGPSTSPPGARGAYRFAESPTGGTHLTAVIVSIFLSSSLAWTTRRR